MANIYNKAGPACQFLCCACILTGSLNGSGRIFQYLTFRLLRAVQNPMKSTIFSKDSPFRESEPPHLVSVFNLYHERHALLFANWFLQSEVLIYYSVFYCVKNWILEQSPLMRVDINQSRILGLSLAVDRFQWILKKWIFLLQVQAGLSVLI